VKHRNRKIAISLFFLFLYTAIAQAQFYNGHQMRFGKNRVQYQDFYWQFYRYENYDIYFNQFGKELAEDVASTAEKEITRMERYFDYTLDNRLIFIVFNNLSEFRQSNIGLVTGKEEYNIGGVTQLSRNKVFIYFNGDHNQLKEQITKAISQVLSNEMLYGAELKDNLANSTLLNLPEWYEEGLISYLSEGWNLEVENRVKDGILNGKYKKFNRLYGDDAVYAGHSMWRYIAKTYGDDVIPNILYLTRVNKKYNMGFVYALGGIDIKQLTEEWYDFYLEKFSDYPDDLTYPSKGQKVLKRSRKQRLYAQATMNSTGKYVAYTTNYLGRYKVWMHELATDRKKVILRDGHKIEQIVDHSYPVLAWHPSGRILSFITEEEGGIKLYFYTVYSDELDVRNLLYFEKVLDFSYSPDGSKLVISGVRNGRTDIYVHTLASSTNEQITNDIADDFNPAFINGGDDIIFSSNRVTRFRNIEESTEKTAPTFDLFIHEYNKGSDELFRLDNYEFTNEMQPIEYDKNEYLFLSDANGIRNRYISQFDSTIAFIDTTIHYRYFSRTSPLTNYAYNISEFDYNPQTNEFVEVVYYDKKYNIYKGEMLKEKKGDKLPFQTRYIRQQQEAYKQQDSINNVKKQVIPITAIENNRIVADNDTIILDDGIVDINNYIFEKEKINYYSNKLNKWNLDIVLDTAREDKKIRIYQPTFYVNHLVNQISFSFLNQSYQVFTGEDAFYNPSFNLLQKVGANDLFEDYKLIAGFGFTPSFDGLEYLLSIENLKHRIDHQLVYHRQSIVNQNANTPIKTISNHGFYVRRYPFSQVAAFESTWSLRHSNIIYLPINELTLRESNQQRFWGGVKLSYIFDNTRSLGTNLHDGWRFKIFGEAYKQLNPAYDNLFTLGGDFRNYLKIHRDLILATRFAGSTSFGSAPIVYFLGGVDNWLPINNFFRGNIGFQQFIPLSEIPVDQDKNYAYRSLATNMRGFQQNIRNGNNFMIFNQELRWPIIRYLINRPLSSGFLNNFQVVGFFDAGSAWTGLTPYSGKNAYDTQTLEQNPVTLVVDTNRDPIVYGYGFGVRTQLLGYFVRLDFSWGVENNVIQPMLFYLSFNLDF
jgi:hypothetical protein